MYRKILKQCWTGEQKNNISKKSFSLIRITFETTGINVCKPAAKQRTEKYLFPSNFISQLTLNPKGCCHIQELLPQQRPTSQIQNPSYSLPNSDVSLVGIFPRLLLLRTLFFNSSSVSIRKNNIVSVAYEPTESVTKFWNQMTSDVSPST